MDELMGPATGSHPISIPILLIALTIQGVIPDAHDLASLRALNLVCMVLINLDSSSNDCDSADDVCGPVRSGITSEMRELLKRLASTGFELPGPTVPSIGRGALRFSSLPSPIVRIDDLIHSLCRLIC
jgi:hypothetical protein